MYSNDLLLVSVRFKKSLPSRWYQSNERKAVAEIGIVLKEHKQRGRPAFSAHVRTYWFFICKNGLNLLFIYLPGKYLCTFASYFKVICIQVTKSDWHKTKRIWKINRHQTDVILRGRMIMRYKKCPCFMTLTLCHVIYHFHRYRFISSIFALHNVTPIRRPEVTSQAGNKEVPGSSFEKGTRLKKIRNKQ